MFFFLPRVSCSKTNRHWLLMLFLAFDCLKMLKDLCRYAMSSLPAFSTAKDVNLLPRWWKGCFPKRWPRPQPSQRLKDICETLQNHGIHIFKLNVIQFIGYCTYQSGLSEFVKNRNQRILFIHCHWKIWWHFEYLRTFNYNLMVFKGGGVRV